MATNNINNNNEISTSVFTQKGDLIVGTTSSSYVVIHTGNNGYVLKCDSNEPSGLKWATS